MNKGTRAGTTSAPRPAHDHLHQKSRNLSNVHPATVNSSGTCYMPPWITPYFIGVGGTSGSGKTSIAAKIVSSINTPWTVLISLDNFYKPLNQEERDQAFKNDYDFDQPEALDLDLAYECLRALKEGKKAVMPVYSFIHHNRVPDKNITVYGASVVVIEGIYALHDKRITDLMDLKVYVDADLDICLARRLSRDIISRGRDLSSCLQQWERFVKPNADKFVKPTMKNADAILPSMSDNSIATKMLINHIQSKLQHKSQNHINELIRLGHESVPLHALHNIHQLPPTNQVRSLQTMILNNNLSRDGFVFYFDRIATILVSNALDNIAATVSETEVITTSGYKVDTPLVVNFDKVTAINIVRSGDCFMRSLRKTIPNIAIGKLLIQSDSQTGEPQLHCEFLPSNIHENFEQVLLMDAQIISGAAIIMAIQVLVDHGVELSNIKVIAYLATEVGIRRIINAFTDKVSIYTGEIISEKAMQENKCNWARVRFIDSRYFGCD
ncbi:HER173Wp [Eremothecium sinecaudum]|uniref:Uridine kinase n=1 Tax=Eremothecium sinecaudum TaxID=45286 RepID=A0A120K2G7_9SACH|nr:HER173Wp [Eremothecium sinecaudum]AMD21452.1 HER173Wp [Eremothecium sinecaudum]